MPHSEDLPLVLIGSGGHARVLLDIVQSLGRRVAAFIDEHRPTPQLNGVPVIEKMELLPLAPSKYGYVVAIGDNFIRARVVASLLAAVPQMHFATLIHPAATTAKNCKIGQGTVVMAGAVVNPETRIGQHCIVNTGALVDHDNVVEDFASLAPGSVTGGNVRINECAAISLGACVIHGMTVGKHSVVGAGAVVVKDVPEYSIVLGVPARFVRPRSAGDPYL